MARKKRQAGEVNAGSMADIAFLLLIFFLLVSSIVTDKGLTLLLPPKSEDQERQEQEFNDRNVFKVLINSQNALLIEGERWESTEGLKEQVKKFVLNRGKDPNMSENPEKAVISLKTDRGTNYELYINVLDELQGAYYEIYANRAGVTPKEFRNMDSDNPKWKKAREGIPMNISIAEPTDIGGGS